MKNLILLLSLIMTTQAHALYEEDNRVDFYKLKDEKMKETARAMAFQIYKDELKGWTFNRYWEIVTSPLTSYGVCRQERFSDQPRMRNDCSAVLIGPKHLLLPGNCITKHYCDNDLFYWMFNYQLDSSGPLSMDRKREYFYKCEKLIKQVFDRNTAISYAVIELNKAVVGIKPVRISKELTIAPDSELVAMGHPSGLPLKVAAGAFVADQNDEHFLVSSDIAGKSKGAAIFNAKTMELEGMLIDGRADFEMKDGCKQSPVYPFSEARELALKVNAMDLEFK